MTKMPIAQALTLVWLRAVRYVYLAHCCRAVAHSESIVGTERWLRMEHQTFEMKRRLVFNRLMIVHQVQRQAAWIKNLWFEVTQVGTMTGKPVLNLNMFLLLANMSCFSWGSTWVLPSAYYMSTSFVPQRVTLCKWTCALWQSLLPFFVVKWEA